VGWFLQNSNDNIIERKSRNRQLGLRFANASFVSPSAFPKLSQESRTISLRAYQLIADNEVKRGNQPFHYAFNMYCMPPGEQFLRV
jgi:hypothetical protein